MREKMIVVKVEKDRIFLSKLEEEGECDSCVLRNICNRSEKTIVIRENAVSVRTGDIVEVELPEAVSTRASLLMYTAPLLIFLSVIVTVKSLTTSDTLAFLSGLAAMGLYYAVLRFMDRKLSERFRPRIVNIERSFSTRFHRDGRKS